eukprot:TRINITY_DN1175_c0_g2_i1.p1 TRINITY_DN1175_c0_g2~~TRINITY_DN1175_c0_g2_i1.p1  ORF type:complete len:238 (+),score=73.25 TRINITY_DN1175_c0_g2_i1:52-765(+)
MPLYKRVKQAQAPIVEEVEEAEAEEESVEEEVEEVEEIEEDSGDDIAEPAVPRDWAERLQITSSKSLRDEDWNVDDDGLREELFEKQALKNVEEAMKLIKQHNIPNTRPNDYYAEMVKSDIHMGKIRDEMAIQKNKIKAQQERRDKKHAQKFGKAVQQQVLQEREAKKADALARIEHLKKKAKKHGMGNTDEDDINVAFGDDNETGEKTKRKRNLTPGGTKRPKKSSSKRPGKSKRR